MQVFQPPHVFQPAQLITIGNFPACTFITVCTIINFWESSSLHIYSICTIIWETRVYRGYRKLWIARAHGLKQGALYTLIQILDFQCLVLQNWVLHLYRYFLGGYSTLSNNCADGINVQAGKFSKINNCADCNKCAGRKISFS